MSAMLEAGPQVKGKISGLCTRTAAACLISFLTATISAAHEYKFDTFWHMHRLFSLTVRIALCVA